MIAGSRGLEGADLERVLMAMATTNPDIVHIVRRPN